MSNLKICLIAAACENMGIGVKGDLPWRLKNEMAYFTRMTSSVTDPNSGKQNAVVMGRKTWDSVPDKYRPFSKRLNIVLSRNDFNGPQDVFAYKDWNRLVSDLKTSPKFDKVDKVWVIGGSKVYETALESSDCHRIYLTRVLQNFDCDTFFPEIDASKFQLVKDPEIPEEEQEENGIRYRFEVYERIA